jgi:hypothetical protein
MTVFTKKQHPAWKWQARDPGQPYDSVRASAYPLCLDRYDLGREPLLFSLDSIGDGRPQGRNLSKLNAVYMLG